MSTSGDYKQQHLIKMANQIAQQHAYPRRHTRADQRAHASVLAV